MTALQPFELATAPLADGTMLLEASAGTGKTYTLVGLLLRHLLEGKLPRLDQALVVTFTVAATAELKTRLRRALLQTLRAVTHGDDDPFFAGLAKLPNAAERLRAALDDFDQVDVATMHGFCKRVLEQAAFQSRQPLQSELTLDPRERQLAAAADALRSLYDTAMAWPAVLAGHHGFTPESLQLDYQRWQLHPGASLQPPPAALPAALEEVAAAAALAQASHDDGVAALLQATVWNKDAAPFGEQAALGLQQLADCLRGPLPLQLPQLLRYAKEELLARANKRKRPVFEHAFFLACERLRVAIAAAKAPLRSHLLAGLHARFLRRNQREQVLSFQDLLQRTYDSLRDPVHGEAPRAALRQRYRIALIDEFQDTDTLQYGIFAPLFADRGLYLIGDPKQSIYAFRGADLRTYLAARADAGRQHTLLVNYRSAAALVTAVQRLFARPGSFASKGIDMPEVVAHARSDQLLVDDDGGPPLRFVCLPGAANGKPLPRKQAEARITADVAAEIARLLQQPARLDGRPLRPRDLAVLTRSHREAALVQAALQTLGIAAVTRGTGDVLRSDEAEDLLRWLVAVLRPHDRGLVRAAAATRWHGLLAADLQALHDDSDALDLLQQRFAQWRNRWQQQGYMAMQWAAQLECGTEARLLAAQDGDRRLTNYQHLYELLHQREHQQRCSPEALLAWLADSRSALQDGEREERELRLPRDAEAVQLLTMHGSKGLEFEIVFCPFLWAWQRDADHGVVRDPQHGLQFHFELPERDPHRHSHQVDQLAEDLRLAYVALTRAKRRCYVHWGAIGRSQQENSWHSALGWLLATALPAMDGADWLAIWRTQQATAQTGAVDAATATVARLGAVATLRVLPPGDDDDDADADDAPVAATPPDAAVPASSLPSRSLPRPPRARGQHSYSSLVQQAEATPSADEAIAAGAVDEALTVADAASGEPSGEPSGDASSDATPTGIFAFARGPGPGACLHTILEQVQLGRLDATDRATVERLLAEAGLWHAGPQPSTAHRAAIDPVAVVMDMLHSLLAATLPRQGTPLRPLLLAEASIEWQFTLPLASGASGSLASTTADLARRFATSDSPIARDYSSRLQRLPDRALRGFLVGFIDRVVACDGRYWVLDWKSNHLGNHAADYHDANLWQAMHEHDYVLQYHLYVLALHRQLRARLPGYTPERHLGGVLYPFLRGLVAGSSHGIAQDEVPASLVASLDAWAMGERL